MKVFVQVINTKTGGYQYEMIDEPVRSGCEVLNALKHFGIDDVNWTMVDADELWEAKFGTIEGTNKIVSVIII